MKPLTKAQLDAIVFEVANQTCETRDCTHSLVQLISAEAYWRNIVMSTDPVKYRGFECRFCRAFNNDGPVTHAASCAWILAREAAGTPAPRRPSNPTGGVTAYCWGCGFQERLRPQEVFYDDKTGDFPDSYRCLECNGQLHNKLK